MSENNVSPQPSVDTFRRYDRADECGGQVPGATWTAIDGRIDVVLTSIRDANPSPTTEIQALNDLLTALR
jgi:hypothetical protein